MYICVVTREYYISEGIFANDTAIAAYAMATEYLFVSNNTGIRIVYYLSPVWGIDKKTATNKTIKVVRPGAQETEQPGVPSMCSNQ